MTTTFDTEALAIVAAEGIWDVTRIGGALPNCCVLGTRLLIDVLDSYGVASKAGAVRVLVGNHKGIEHIQGGDTGKPWPEGAWTVGVDSRIPTDQLTTPAPEGKGYAGHLITYVRRDDRPTLMIDPTVQQFHRPQHELDVLGPVAGPVPAEWEQGVPLVVTFPTGAAVYWHDPAAPGYQHARDWRRDARSRSFVRYVRGYVEKNQARVDEIATELDERAS